MTKIKLKFKNEWDEYAFYDRCWCQGHNFLQCTTCARNPHLYENWSPPGAFTGFAPSGENLQAAKNGECHMYTEIHTSDYKPKLDKE